MNKMNDRTDFTKGQDPANGAGRIKGEKLYILYDGVCNLCLASVRRMKELPSSAELHDVSIQSLADDGGAAAIPAVASMSQEQLLAKIHVVDMEGNIFAGADGIVRIMRTVRGFQWLAGLYRIPGMGRVANALYRFIASRRYDWFGKTDESCHAGACSLPNHNRPNKTE
ncbi:hypothetical protein PAECIP111893_02207 [Paenibacillus plantiphilus]|uniref:DCC family thiol-disulfide oxidoreductase YuxK n=1 Tax=Paenibacillus plantiphilus TaxID=2905650 RepID=A0ABN8GA59_9BACL|nr:DUF393 domain-containing protein [Paenibacillus plantiphilus]CAH1204265.1 hypothetical protein PAECIP111893_02207 [Paenibacillus plantiphilus]